MRQCPKCKERAVELYEFSTCVSCAKARVLSLEESLAACAAHEVVFLDGTEEVYRRRQSGFVPALVRVMDDLMLADFRGAVMERKILLAVLDRVGEVHALRPKGSEGADVATDVSKFVYGTIDLARLRSLRYDVKQGATAVVDAYEMKEQPRMLKQWRLGPPGFASPEEHFWKRLTRIHWGTGADALVDEEDFLRAVGESDPSANVLALAHSLGLPLLPFANHEDRQIHKLYAPKTIGRCEALTLPELQRLDTVLAFLIGEENSPRSALLRKAGRAPRINATDFDRWLQKNGLQDVAPRIIADADSPTLIPLMFRHGKNYVFSPRQALVFRRMLQSYAADYSDAPMAIRAGGGFEFFVSRVLAKCGLTTTHNGRELVGVSLGKKAFEIDSLAFDERRVYLVDAKCEMEPPGAWSAEYVEKRKRETENHRSKLLAKVSHWQARLSEARPRLRLADKTELVLPNPLLPGRTITPLVVSARLEPVLAEPGNLVSFVPPKAASVMARHLPMHRFVPVWTGMAPP